MELDILHRAVAPEIVEFYGAFFIESCVYYCMEVRLAYPSSLSFIHHCRFHRTPPPQYMDAGSLDKLLGAGVPEDVLARIASSVVKGLKFLKDELQIIHRGTVLYTYKRTPILTHPPTTRHKTHQRPSKPQRPNQTLRLWRIRPTRKIPRQNQHRVPILHGSRTHQRRVPKQPRDIHRFVRRVECGVVDD